MLNDDENSYTYVMRCLITYCDHSREQAEQCAIIAHNNGKCNIKEGSLDSIIDLKFELAATSLKVEIESLV